MKQAGFVFAIIIFLLCFGGRPLSAQTAKDGSMAKLAAPLLNLHDQYAAHLVKRSGTLFISPDPLIRLVDDLVVIDAVASGDVNSLKADLESLGMQHAIAFGRFVSGQLPVSMIPAAARLTSLTFSRSCC